MKILITGVAGLIGSNLANYIIENKQNVKIIGIDNLSGGYENNINEKINFYKEDLLHFNKIEDIFKEHTFDYIIHFAAYAAEGLSPFIRKFNYNNNLLVTTNLVNLAIKYGTKRFIFTSSMATYGFGNNDNKAFTEDTSQIPIDPYGIAKLACEMDIKVAATQHNLEYCILRPHNVYGKNQNIWDRYRNVLGIWMYQILNNEDITIYGTGQQTRAFSYIDDMLEPIWKAIISDKSKNQEINLGGFYEIKLIDAANLLIKITGKGNIKYLEGRHEVKHAYCSYQKSIELLDFNMKIQLEQGLKNMWEWAKTQPNRQRVKWDKYELDKGIYSFWKF
jgi:UDP-glucose 4-epimerase